VAQPSEDSSTLEIGSPTMPASFSDRPSRSCNCPLLPAMCDDNVPCGHGRSSNGNRDHCHYEHRHRSTRGRGLLRRSSTSNVINCHQHRGSSPKHCVESDHTTRQCSCHHSNSQAYHGQHLDRLSGPIDQLRAQQRRTNNGQGAGRDQETLHQTSTYPPEPAISHT
jgi:hypothetical protein